MWLRRLVGICMILTCVGLNILTVLGLVLPDKSATTAAANTAASSIPAAASLPTVSLTADPSSIAAGSSSVLTWTTSGDPTDCTASGSWSGAKTAEGTESTGRISTSGNYTYSLACGNAGGKAEASAVVTVGNAPKPATPSTTSSSPNTAATTPSYCGGRLPCYGPKDVAAHSSKGNCWGWNGDRVLNISGFDAAFHVAATGIDTIQISSICGHDIAPALSGQVSTPSAGGHNHQQSTKQNADANEIPYFTGYFDASK